MNELYVNVVQNLLIPAILNIKNVIFATSGKETSHTRSYFRTLISSSLLTLTINLLIFCLILIDSSSVLHPVYTFSKPLIAGSNWGQQKETIFERNRYLKFRFTSK